MPLIPSRRCANAVVASDPTIYRNIDLMDDIDSECANCGGDTHVSSERISINYGIGAEAVVISFIAPVSTCLRCQSQFTALGYEEAESQAIKDCFGR